MESKIELGDTVKDIYSGFKGVAVNRTEFINGCVQFGVVAIIPKSKAFISPEDVAIDSKSLVVVKKGLRHKKEVEENGGPMRKGPKQRGF